MSSELMRQKSVKALDRPKMERQESLYDRYDINNRTIADVVSSAFDAPCKHKIAKEIRKAAKEEFKIKKQESLRSLMARSKSGSGSVRSMSNGCGNNSNNLAVGGGSSVRSLKRQDSRSSVRSSLNSSNHNNTNMGMNDSASIDYGYGDYDYEDDDDDDENKSNDNVDYGYGDRSIGEVDEDDENDDYDDDFDDNDYNNHNNNQYGMEEQPGRPSSSFSAREQYSFRNRAPKDEYRDKFLDVCRLDEARSKLIGKVEEPNMIKLLSHWTGTILNEVIYDVVFWLTILLYVALRIWIHNAGSQSNDNGEMEAIATEATVLDSLPIVGGFLTFFLVFFVNQNHGRYYSLHDSTMSIMGRICDLASLLTAASPLLPIERARRINRYCNAAHVVMYAGLTEYLQEGQLVHNLCRDYALLTDKETHRMEQCGLYKGKASACFELLTWALMDVNRALDAEMIDSHQASEMREHIVQFRSTIAKIVVTCLCPIPFFYVHFLSLLTAIYLPLFALMVSFKTGFVDDYDENNIPWYAEIVGFFLVLMQCIFVVGLRILGQELGNPYGEDFVDIQITTYIIMVLSTSNRILESMDVNDIDGDVSPETELSLKLGMVNLGDAWGIKQSSHTTTTTTTTATTKSSSTQSSGSRRSSYSSTSTVDSKSSFSSPFQLSSFTDRNENRNNNNQNQNYNHNNNATNNNNNGRRSSLRRNSLQQYQGNITDDLRNFDDFDDDDDDANIGNNNNSNTTELRRRRSSINSTTSFTSTSNYRPTAKKQCQIEALEREIFGPDGSIHKSMSNSDLLTIGNGNSNNDEDANNDIDSNRSYSMLPKELQQKYMMNKDQKTLCPYPTSEC